MPLVQSLLSFEADDEMAGLVLVYSEACLVYSSEGKVFH